LSYQLLPVHHVMLTPGEDLDEAPFMAAAARLPASVNLYTRAGSTKIPIDDQGAFGSCTACAIRYAWNLWKMRQNSNAILVLPSRAFWYAQSRIRLGDAPPTLEDFGSTNEATMWALTNKGQMPESAYPYSPQNLSRYPPPAILNGGTLSNNPNPTRFRFSSNAAANIANLQTSLVNGQSVVVAIMVYSSFMTNSVMRSGVIPLPNQSVERLLGGHAICISGYTGNFFTFRNSWGSNVGVNGTFQIPMAYLGNWNLTGDAWII